MQRGGFPASAIEKAIGAPGQNKPIHVLNLIDGEWVEANAGQRIDIINPSNSGMVGSAPAGITLDVDLAVAWARRSLEVGDWRGMLPSARTKMLTIVADLIDKHVAEITHLEVLTNGMTENSRGTVCRRCAWWMPPSSCPAYRVAIPTLPP
jgi:acyl-CoA reductase-like NAD-dependent aldehyde dehydrogenase